MSPRYHMILSLLGLVCISVPGEPFATVVFGQRGPLSPKDVRPTLVADPVVEHDTAISTTTNEHLAGERFVDGRITAIRSEQIIVDIGNPQLLYLPLKPALDKGLVFQIGDAIVVTMNDHNAIVDYHHARGESHHQVIHGQLLEPLPVGQDKAILRTSEGEQSYPIASRARGKLGAMPVGADLVFLTDETGQLVDAQLASENAVYQSSLNNKAARLTGVNQRVKALYKKTKPGTHEITVVIPPDDKEQVLAFRPPLAILQELKANQPVVLLLDKEHYVVDIATSSPPPEEYRRTPEGH
ncbi:MAG: hypothetical protein M3Z35_00460 [Nitrospirota bacterium]|nr:hypothetical protein [Nitrospirota bacterium]